MVNEWDGKAICKSTFICACMLAVILYYQQDVRQTTLLLLLLTHVPDCNVTMLLTSTLRHTKRVWWHLIVSIFFGSQTVRKCFLLLA